MGVVRVLADKQIFDKGVTSFGDLNQGSQVHIDSLGLHTTQRKVSKAALKFLFFHSKNHNVLKMMGLDVNLKYGDLENGNLESRTQKRDHSIPYYNHAPRPNPPPHSTNTLPRNLPHPQPKLRQKWPIPRIYCFCKKNLLWRRLFRRSSRYHFHSTS